MMNQDKKQQKSTLHSSQKKAYSPPRLLKMGDIVAVTLGNSGGPYCDMNYGTRSGNGNGGVLCS